jgi:hypothetical protein
MATEKSNLRPAEQGAVSQQPESKAPRTEHFQSETHQDYGGREMKDDLKREQKQQSDQQHYQKRMVEALKRAQKQQSDQQQQ